LWLAFSAVCFGSSPPAGTPVVADQFPRPATMALLGAGLIGIGLLGRKAKT
jgi:hypothetical protein